jgi:hypothetical protein
VNRKGAAVAATVVACAIVRSRRRAAAGIVGWAAPRLAAWIPPAPAGAIARAATVLWASPITFTGLIAGAAAGVRPRIRDGVVLFAPARGLTGAAVRRRGFAAAGLGHVVISLEEPTAALMTHELVHVRQAERLGPFMAPAYLALLAVHGYQRHPMERAARQAAQTRGLSPQ